MKLVVAERQYVPQEQWIYQTHQCSNCLTSIEHNYCALHLRNHLLHFPLEKNWNVKKNIANILNHFHFFFFIIIEFELECVLCTQKEYNVCSNRTMKRIENLETLKTKRDKT